MNRFLMIAVALLLAAAPLCGQSRSDERAARKEAVAAAKTLRREGFKPMELGDIRTRLKVAREFPVDKLAEQTVPDIIRLPRNGSCDSSNSVFVPAGTDEELPFA